MLAEVSLSLLVAVIACACYWPITYRVCWHMWMTFTATIFILKVAHMGNISMITGKEVKDINAISLSPLRDSWIVNDLFCVSVST